MEGIRIREARSEDCEQLVGLIKELAAYERYPQGPQLDADALRRDGFGDEKLFRSVVAEVTKDGSPVLIGHTMYYYVYASWEGINLALEEFYVMPEYRGSGIGTRMLREVAKAGLARGCTRIDFLVLDWNTSAIEYYKRKGAIDLTARGGLHTYRLEKDAVDAIANGK